MKYPMKLLFVIPLIISGLHIIGCATVTRGTKEVLEIKTSPAGAEVTVMKVKEEKIDPEFKKLTGTTPTSFKLSRKHPYKVIVEKDGYESAEVSVNTQVTDAASSKMAGNLCLLYGACIGAGVDAASGAMNKFVPNPIDIHLVALKEIEQREYLTYEGEKFGIPASGSFNDAYAVVIGISKYKHSGRGGG